jgi:hypothetical protein
MSQKPAACPAGDASRKLAVGVEESLGPLPFGTRLGLRTSRATTVWREMKMVVNDGLGLPQGLVDVDG